MTDLIRAARKKQDLTIYQLAQRLGVTAGAVSQLERSEREGTIKIGTLRRALQSLGEDIEMKAKPITMKSKHLMSARSAAEAINAELLAGDDDAALRLTSQAVDHFRQATTSNEIADFLRKPPRIADNKWDTLLATAIAWDAKRRGIAPPRWTSKPPLPEVGS